MNRLVVAFVLVALLCCQALAQETSDAGASKDRKEITYSEIRKLVDDGAVEAASVTGDGWWVNVSTADGSRYYAQVTPQTPIADHLYEAGIPVRIVHWNEEKKEELPLWLSLFFNTLPLIIFLAFFFFVVRMMNNKKKTDEFFNRLEETIKRSMNNG